VTRGLAVAENRPEEAYELTGDGDDDLVRCLPARDEAAVPTCLAMLRVVAHVRGDGPTTIAPERLLKVTLLMALYTVRSERLCEQHDDNTLFLDDGFGSTPGRFSPDTTRRRGAGPAFTPREPRSQVHFSPLQPVIPSRHVDVAPHPAGYALPVSACARSRDAQAAAALDAPAIPRAR
jgi:hypothetical protein